MANWIPTSDVKVRIETMAGAHGINHNHYNDNKGASGNDPLRDSIEQYNERNEIFIKAANIFGKISDEAEKYGGF